MVAIILHLQIHVESPEAIDECGLSKSQRVPVGVKEKYIDREA